jgi:hypothetical protein
MYVVSYLQKFIYNRPYKYTEEDDHAIYTTNGESMAQPTGTHSMTGPLKLAKCLPRKL